MFKQRTVFDINGKTYYSPIAAGDRWSISHQAVVSACKDGRIVGAFRDSTNHWCIPESAFKPISKDDIRKILICSLYLKNKPDLQMENCNQNNMVAVYSYLKDIGYIEDFNSNSNRIPYEIVLTDKGMSLVVNHNKIDINWATIIKDVIELTTQFMAFYNNLLVLRQ